MLYRLNRYRQNKELKNQKSFNQTDGVKTKGVTIIDISYPLAGISVSDPASPRSFWWRAPIYKVAIIRFTNPLSVSPCTRIEKSTTAYVTAKIT